MNGRATGRSARPTHQLAAAQAGGRVLSLGLQLLHFALLARWFGPDRFGPFAAGLALASMAGVVAEFGVPTTMLVERAERRRSVVWSAGLRAVALTAVLGSSAAAVVALLALDGEARTAALVLLAWTVAGRLRAVAVAVRQADLAVGRVAGAEIATRGVAVTAAACGWAFALEGDARLVAAAGGMAVGEVAGMVVAWPGRPSSAPWSEVVGLLRRCRHFGLTASVASVHSRIDQVLLDALRVGRGGPYAVAYRLVDASLAVATAANALIVPLLARAEDDARWRLARAATSAAALFALAVGGAIALAAPGLVAVVGGPGYGDAVPLVRVLALVLIVAVINVPLLHLVMVAGRSERLVHINLAMVAVNLGLNLALLPRWGAEGAAWATLASETMGLVLVAGVAHRCHPGVLPTLRPWRDLAPLRARPQPQADPSDRETSPSAPAAGVPEQRTGVAGP
ncbi:MAG: lipopolysaccharide biosynthesis protein [Actinomycetota bacterium]